MFRMMVPITSNEVNEVPKLNIVKNCKMQSHKVYIYSKMQNNTVQVE